MTELNRRSFLALGTASLGWAALPRQVRAATSQPRRVRGVIWLWMAGGMPQVHTWDPKPRLTKREIGTPFEGIQFSEFLPTCAAQMGNLSVLRSVTHGAGDHAFATLAMRTGKLTSTDRDVPPIGTILARELGPKDFPLPRYITIGPQNIPATAHFPTEYHPFLVNGADSGILPNLRRNVDTARDSERAALLLEQNREWGLLRQQPGVQRLETGAVQADALINTPMLKAFNVSLEPADLRDAYGEGFGHNCLMARRLVEAGCPFVEVGLGGWDRSWKTAAPQLDRGFGTLVRDLSEKNLLRDVLVVCATEFGRNPTSAFAMEPWSRGFSIVLAGGLLAGGRVIGDTGTNGEECRSPVSLPDLFATIYQACGVDPRTTYEFQGRKWKYLEGGKPVAELF